MAIGARRILVYGVTGSGKTTLARRISEATGLPWHSVDDLTWEPGWVVIAEEIQRERISAICAGREWILDSAYGKWIDIPLAEVELIVALDYSRWLSFRRLFARTVRRAITREKACNGNVEPAFKMFSKESILAWHFKSFARKHERIVNWEQAPQGPKVLRFERPIQTEEWLRGLSASES